MDSFALARIFLSLLLVIALILACAWLARRNGMAGLRGQRSQLSVSAKLALGTRGMQILVVDVEDARLVVGVTPGGISVLHKLPPLAELPADLAHAKPAGPSFQNVLRSILRPSQAK